MTQVACLESLVMKDGKLLVDETIVPTPIVPTIHNKNIVKKGVQKDVCKEVAAAIAAQEEIKDESRPGAKKGRYEWLLNAEFAFDTIVLRDRLPALLDIRTKIEGLVKTEHDKIMLETNEEVKAASQTRFEALTQIMKELGGIPNRPVIIRADNANEARMENQEIERKTFEFLKDMGKSFNTLMGGDLDEVIQQSQEVVVGILKRANYPLCEIMTPDAKQRFGFVGYIPEEANPFRKIDWAKDQIRMSVIFRNPSAKRGEDNKIRIPRELGLRYSNLNSLNGVVKAYVDEHYTPFNQFVNEYQVKRFRDAHGEHVDADGIRWVKRGGDTTLSAIDEKGVFGKAGTLLGIGKIIRTKNNASFTWWESGNPELPRNAFITAATDNIIRCASAARIET